MKQCHRCEASWDESGQPGFNNLCHGCGMPLHACRNCTSFVPRGAVRCVIAEAPRIRDPQAGNHCPHFEFREDGGGREREEGFGGGGGGGRRGDPEDARRAWNQLFKDS